MGGAVGSSIGGVGRGVGKSVGAGGRGMGMRRRQG